jgi:hypothetical protein
MNTTVLAQPRQLVRYFQVYVFMCTSLRTSCSQKNGVYPLLSTSDHFSHYSFPSPCNSVWEDCYSLADYLENSSFKDALIDCALEIMKASGRAWVTLSPTIYEHSGIDSPNRKFAIAATVAGVSNLRTTDYTTEPEDEELLAGLLLDLAKAQRKEEALANPLEEVVDTCVYHEHIRDGGECYKVKRGWLYK